MSADHTPQDRPPHESGRPLCGLSPLIEPPPHLEDRVVERLRERRLLEEEPARGPTGARVAWAASILAAFLLGLGIRGEGSALRANYLLLLDRAPGPELSAAQIEQRVAEYGAWAQQLRDEGVLVAAERLVPGEELFGPGESVASPSGIFLFRAGNEDEARSAASACPHLRHGGTVSLQAIDVR